MERTNARLGQFRRLLVCHEHLLSTYYAFFYLACLWITLRRCLLIPVIPASDSETN